MRKFSAILTLVIAAALMFDGTAWAFGEIRYSDRPLNLRNARSAKATWVGSLHAGQKVRIAYLKDGWVAVFEPNETRNSLSAAVGYSNAKYLKPKPGKVEVKPWGELMFSDRKLNVRSKPSRRGKHLKTLKVMEQVKVDFPEDDWVMVFSPDATIRSKMNGIGYSSVKYLQPVAVSSQAAASPKAVVAPVKEAGSGQGEVKSSVTPAPAKKAVAPVKPTASADWGNVVTVKRKVNIRQGRTSSSKHIRTLQPGERVKVDYLRSGWYAVFDSGELIRNEKRAVGYALRSLIDGDDGSHSIPVTVEKSTTKSGTSVSTPRPKEASKATTLVIDRSKFKQTKRPDPTPNKSAHGYQYRLVEKSETRQFGESWITLKVFLSTKKLPATAALKDFSTTLWREHRKATKNLAVLVFLPGMDVDDLSYGVVKFNEEGMFEYWVRKTALFGTDFL